MNTLIKDIPHKSSNIVFRKIGGEFMLVPIGNNVADFENVYLLDDVGAAIWALIDGKRDIQGLCDAVCAEYDIARDKALADIQEFLDSLRLFGAVAFKDGAVP